MNSKMIINVAAIAVIAGALIWFARSGAAPEEKQTIDAKGVLTALENSYDFGTVSMAKGKVTHEFKVKNNGSESAKIVKFYTSCMCTEAKVMHNGKTFGPVGMPGHLPVPTINEVIEAGEEATVEVTFDPAAHGPAGVGKISRIVYLDNPNGRPLELNFTATVTP
ncbi:MAG: Uncharacterized protein HW383_114 [Candidatus Magasanikbacteria bacterium]|nr:Uncharacterized protein [Candidatus Magasanikbacteria bacterium]